LGVFFSGTRRGKSGFNPPPTLIRKRGGPGARKNLGIFFKKACWEEKKLERNWGLPGQGRRGAFCAGCGFFSPPISFFGWGGAFGRVLRGFRGGRRFSGGEGFWATRGSKGQKICWICFLPGGPGPGLFFLFFPRQCGVWAIFHGAQFGN